MQENVYRLDADILSLRLAEMGKLGVRSIMFAGEGEPLLHRDLSKMVRSAKESGLDVALTTNGTNGSVGMWDSIMPYLSWIRFSADAATSSIYSKIHCVPEGTFYRTVRSIEDAVKVRNNSDLDVTIGIQFLLMEENVKDVEESIRIYSDLKVDYISFKPYSQHPRMLNKREINYTEEYLDYVDATVNKYKAKTNTDIIFRKSAALSYIASRNKYDHCYALPFWGYISSRGDFYTCSVFLNDDRFKAGNIYEKKMGDILSGEDRERSVLLGRNELIIHDECRVNCRMARINEFLDFLQRKPDHINFV